MTEVTDGPYEPRICKGVPADCCDYAVVSLSAGREVCRVWTEADARRIAEALAVAPLIEAQVSAEIETLCAERNELNRTIFGLFDTCAKYSAALAQARAAAIEEAARVALSYGTDLRNHDAVRTAGAAIAAAILALASRPVSEREGGEERAAWEGFAKAAQTTPPGYEPYTPATVQAIRETCSTPASRTPKQET